MRSGRIGSLCQYWNSSEREKGGGEGVAGYGAKDWSFSLGCKGDLLGRRFVVIKACDCLALSLSRWLAWSFVRIGFVLLSLLCGLYLTRPSRPLRRRCSSYVKSGVRW